MYHLFLCQQQTGQAPLDTPNKAYGPPQTSSFDRNNNQNAPNQSWVTNLSGMLYNPPPRRRNTTTARRTTTRRTTPDRLTNARTRTRTPNRISNRLNQNRVNDTRSQNVLGGSLSVQVKYNFGPNNEGAEISIIRPDDQNTVFNITASPPSSSSAPLISTPAPLTYVPPPPRQSLIPPVSVIPKKYEKIVKQSVLTPPPGYVAPRDPILSIQVAKSQPQSPPKHFVAMFTH